MLFRSGILPGNDGRGYVLRRLLRRAVRHGKLLGVGEPFLYKAVDTVVREYGDFYPELVKGHDYIKKVVRLEEERFHETLEQGMKILNEQMFKIGKRGIFPGDAAFKLYDTYGFPVDLTKEILAEQELILDEQGYQNALEAQRERGRSARGTAVFGKEEGMWQQLDDIKTQFVGYDALDTVSSILGLFQKGERVTSASQGDEVDIVLGVTPFYGEKIGRAHV